MKRNSLFLSVLLTTAILVVIGGALRAGAAGFFLHSNYPTPQVSPTPESSPSPTSAFLSPQEAVTIASALVTQSEVYRIDTVKVDGMDAYKITFSSGDQVYVDASTGKILLHTVLTQTIYQQSEDHPGQSSGGNQTDDEFSSAAQPRAQMGTPAPFYYHFEDEDEGGGD